MKKVVKTLFPISRTIWNFAPKSKTRANVKTQDKKVVKTLAWVSLFFHQNLLFRQGQQLEGGLGREEGGKDFVSNLEDVLEFRTHSMVLGGQKGRIQDDTYGHSRFKKHVVSHSEHEVLKLNPRMITQTTFRTTSTITVFWLLWNNERNGLFYSTV